MGEDTYSKSVRNAEIFAEICYNKINDSAFDIILPPAEELARMLRKCKLTKGKNKKALDFSCGEGRNSEYLFQLGYDVVATEVSESAINAASQRFRQHNVDIQLTLLDISREPIARLPFPDDYFDLIVAWQCLHWLGSKENFIAHIKEFYRILKKSGDFILTMPTDKHRYKRVSLECGESLYRLIDKRREGGIIFAPNFVTLQHILQEHGFLIDKKMGFAVWDDGFDWTEDMPQSDYNLHAVPIAPNERPTAG